MTKDEMWQGETWRPMGVDLWLWLGRNGAWSLGVDMGYKRLGNYRPLGPGWEDLTEWEIGWLEVDGGYGDDGTQERETMHVLAGHDDVDAALDIAVILGHLRHKMGEADVLALRHQVCGAIVNRFSAPSPHCADCAVVAERARDRLGWA